MIMNVSCAELKETNSSIRVIICQIMEAAPLGSYNNVIDDDKHVTYLLS